MDKARAQRERFTCKDASWRRMLVSQSPLRVCPAPNEASSVACLWWQLEIPPLGHFEKMSVGRIGRMDGECDNDLLRMGRLYDIVQHVAGDHELRNLWFK